MNQLLPIALGGGLGAILRYGCGLIAARVSQAPGLWATLFVNVTGSLAMGLFLGWWFGKADPDSTSRLVLFVTVGLLGGFTTYSSFSMEVVELLRQSRFGAAGLYAFGTTVFSVLGFLVGFSLMRDMQL